MLMEKKAKVEAYINVVERESKLFKIKGQAYKEKIRAGAFEYSLSKYGDVPLILNHNKDFIIAEKEDLILYEDNVGLMALFKTDNTDIINKLVNNEIVGCSFGFVAEELKEKQEKGYILRIIEKLKLTEVSLIDKTKVPMYAAQGIVRTEIPRELEQRVYQCKMSKIELRDYYKKFEDKIKAFDNVESSYGYKKRY